MAHSAGSNQKSNNTMKITFEINQPADKYETGRLIRTYTTPHEIAKALQDDRRLLKDPVAFAAALTSSLAVGNVSYTDKAPHFLVVSTLSLECTEPYIKGIEKLAGNSMPEFYTRQIDLMHAFQSESPFTHLTQAYLQHGHLCYEVAQADYYPEKDLDARWQKAEMAALNCMEETVNVRPYHKEFVECGGGRFKLNPLYANRVKLPVRHCIGFVPMWDALLMWWKNNVASPLQKAAVEEIIEGGSDKKKAHLLGYSGDLSWHPDYNLYLPDANGPVIYGSGAVARVRIIKDLSKESLKGWTPGINITTTTSDI
jgi:hypothetical protein